MIQLESALPLISTSPNWATSNCKVNHGGWYCSSNSWDEVLQPVTSGVLEEPEIHQWQQLWCRGQWSDNCPGENGVYGGSIEGGTAAHTSGCLSWLRSREGLTIRTELLNCGGKGHLSHEYPFPKMSHGCRETGGLLCSEVSTGRQSAGSCNHCYTPCQYALGRTTQWKAKLIGCPWTF